MGILHELSRELGDLVARAAPAVVGLVHRGGQGSGVVLSPDGYVLTNCHVARAASSLRVRLPGGAETEGTLVGTDDRTDLAVVRASARALPALELSDQSRLRVGE